MCIQTKVCVYLTAEKPMEARKGRSSFELLVVPGGAYGGHETIFAPGKLKDFSKNW